MKRNTAETSKTKWFVGSKPELRFTTPRDIERRIGHATSDRRRTIRPQSAADERLMRQGRHPLMKSISRDG